MDKIAFYNFEANFALYQNEYDDKVTIYPKVDDEEKQEENITLLLKYILKEVNKFKLLKESSANQSEVFVENFKISAYLNRLGEINYPISSEIKSLLGQILITAKEIYKI